MIRRHSTPFPGVTPGMRAPLLLLILLAGGSTLLTASCAAPEARRAQDRPNIVYLLADDLGVGDLSCLNPDSKIATFEDPDGNYFQLMTPMEM